MVVTAPVAVGEVIERSDLSTVDVAGDITAIAGANLESVVGERAAVALLPDTVLQRSMVTDADPTPTGMVQVGVAVKGGQLPADGLAPGDRVQVLRAARPAGGDRGSRRAGGRGRSGDGVRRAAGPGAGRGDPADPAGAGRAGRGGGGGQRRRCGGVGEGAGVVIVSVCSDKGSPGVTTLATALGLVWPGERVVLDADTAGGDLPFRLWRATVRGAGGAVVAGPVDRGAGHGGPAGADRRPVRCRSRRTPRWGCRWCRVRCPRNGSGRCASLWPRVAAELAAWPGTVIADLGRLQPGNAASAGGAGVDRGAAGHPGRPGGPGASAGPGGRARRRGRRPGPGPVPGGGGGDRPGRRPGGSAVEQVRQVLASIGSPVPVVGFLAHDPAGGARRCGPG